MSSNHIYYIYAYLRKNGIPYYIGKGKNSRAYEAHGKRIQVPKEKNRIIIMESSLSEIGALALERRYIRWYGRKDLGTGVLYNKTEGGDSLHGYIPSKETREKISRAFIGKFVGEKNPMFGKIPWNKGLPRSEETKRKISESRAGKFIGEKNHFFGKKHTEETKQKMRKPKPNVIKRIDCNLCGKEVTKNSLTQHQKSKQCINILTLHKI